MLHRYFTLALFTLLLQVPLGLSAQSEATGYWLAEEEDMAVEIYLSGDTMYGRIVWLLDSVNYYGQPALDVMNPEPRYRSRPILGVDILTAFEWKNDAWRNGKYYNWKTGNSYNGKITVEEDGTLRVKGFYGILFFLGKTKYWTRLNSLEDVPVAP